MAIPFTIPGALADEVHRSLGVPVPTDLAGVGALARAWSSRIPFDPVAKVLAMQAGDVPPGEDPAPVAERWLDTGLGSTCWGQCTLLAAVLDHAGIDTSLGVQRARRHDGIVQFHAFLVVTLDEGVVSLDPFHVSATPLRHRSGAAGDHPAYRMWVTEERGSGRLVYVIGNDDPEGRDFEFVVVGEGLDAADVRAFLQVSATHSRLGNEFFLRRVRADRRQRFSPSADGSCLVEESAGRGVATSTREIADVDEALAGAGLLPPARRVIEAAGMLADGPVRWLT